MTDLAQELLISMIRALWPVACFLYLVAFGPTRHRAWGVVADVRSNAGDDVDGSRW